MPQSIENRARFSAAQVGAQVGAHVSETAVKTAKLLISAEERMRQRVRASLRVVLATLFFAISSLIAIGANVTTAFAKKAGLEKTKNHPGLRLKRLRSHNRGAHRNHHFAKVSTHGSQMRGVASWYGNEFHNRKTASGVRFNTHAMMAAHRTLPFGTKVLVTNLANHKSCVVKITDRGPYAHGRIIDLSLAAAEQLGMTESGIADVELHVLGAAEPSRFDDLASDPSMNATPLVEDALGH